MNYTLPCSHPATVDVHQAGIGENRLVQNQSDEVDLTRIDLDENDKLQNQSKIHGIIPELIAKLYSKLQAVVKSTTYWCFIILCILPNHQKSPYFLAQGEKLCINFDTHRNLLNESKIEVQQVLRTKKIQKHCPNLDEFLT